MTVDSHGEANGSWLSLSRARAGPHFESPRTSRGTIGTHDGPLDDIEPTGKSINITGQIISRFGGTKIAEEWEVFDELGML